MTKHFLETSIQTNATAANIWEVFTNPAITREMGGEYVSDWKVGGSFGFQGLGGAMYTSGRILKIEPQKLLQHSLFGKDGSIISTITYVFDENDMGAVLHAREDYEVPVEDREYEDALEGWNAALGQIKIIAEKQR